MANSGRYADPARRSVQPCPAGSAFRSVSACAGAGMAEPRLAACSAWRGKSSKARRAARGTVARDRRNPAQIDRVADDRVPRCATDARESDGCGRWPAGTPAARRPVCQARMRAVAGEGGFAAFCHHRHALAVARVAADRRLRSPLQRGWAAPAQRAGRPGPGRGRRRRSVSACAGKLGLGDDHHPGGVLVQPVDDARPRLRADAGEARRRNAPAGALTSVPSRLPGAGCTTSPAGLSSTIMSRVFIQDGERDGLRLRRGRRRRGQVEDIGGARPHRFRRLGTRARRRAADRPSSISVLTRERERVAIASARKRSIRWPAWSGPGWKRIGSGVGGECDMPAVDNAARPSAGNKTGMGDGMRALKIGTAVMGVLIVTGTIVLVVTIARRSGTTARPPGLTLAGGRGCGGTG